MPEPFCPTCERYFRLHPPEVCPLCGGPVITPAPVADFPRIARRNFLERSPRQQRERSA
jgi:hypothetical protein